MDRRLVEHKLSHLGVMPPQLRLARSTTISAYRSRFRRLLRIDHLDAGVETHARLTSPRY
ncbi:MAG: hypothetical protein H6816_09435 [Phycisphaerales bacterium]|nr:hypothetical protein [Phycisphaerales bacterium]